MSNPAAKIVAQYPIGEVVDEIRTALQVQKYAVVTAPTGSGKSTVLPLALLDEPYLQNRKIIILEPRRIAAYAVASQLARNLNCEVGDIVGYRMRLDKKVSAATRLEVLTEGMLTRRLQQDPFLEDVGLIIFDEFHERSLQSDLALALTLDTAESLRDDLRILAMSATIESAKTAALLNNAPQIISRGRTYPIEISYHPRRNDWSLSENTAQAVIEAWRSEHGSILAFLPGESDIRNAEKILQTAIHDENTLIVPLYGRLDNAVQRLAIEPPPAGKRKIVLATAIAESSLTIDGIRIVVDCGYTKISRYIPGTNLERLETVPVSQAAAEQRSGRAGRTEPGVAWRLGSEHEHLRRVAMRPSQITYCDLSNLVLELAAWGNCHPEKLKFLEAPPEAAWLAAVKNLRQFNAIDENNCITEHGKFMHRSGLNVRSAHLLAVAAKLQMPLTGLKMATLLDCVDLRRNEWSNISVMLKNFDTDKRFSQARHLSRQIARRLHWGDDLRDCGNLSAGALVAAAFPGQVARRRGSLGELRYLSAGGRESAWRELNDLANYEFITALDLDDKSGNALINLAAGVEAWELEEVLAAEFTEVIALEIDPDALSVEVWADRKLGSITMNRRRAEAPDRTEVCTALAEMIRKHTLSVLHLPEAVTKLQNKLAFILKYDPACGLPDLSNEYILEHIDEMLLTFLPEKISKNMLKNIDWFSAVQSLLDYRQQQQLSALLPERIKLENGHEFRIDYSNDPPVVEGKLQWFFGVRKQPALFNGRLPLAIRLLSPANRPVQTTSDIGNFWSGSYKLVRNDLKGRYPKHDWPENP